MSLLTDSSHFPAKRLPAHVNDKIPNTQMNATILILLTNGMSLALMSPNPFPIASPYTKNTMNCDGVHTHSLCQCTPGAAVAPLQALARLKTGRCGNLSALCQKPRSLMENTR